MSFFKKISKLDDIAFHLVKHLNKKKLKLNLLIVKDWDKIIGTKYCHYSKLNRLTYNSSTDSCSLEISCDPSAILEIRSMLPEITLKIEQKIGIKVKRISFFQDIFNVVIKKGVSNKENSVISSKYLNKSKLNDINDQQVRSIFQRINSSLKNEKN